MLPLIAVPMGDPAGISPEIIVKAIHGKASQYARCVICGSAEILQRTAEQLKLGMLVREILTPKDAVFDDGVINVIPVEAPAFSEIAMGQVDAKCGACAYDCIKKAVELALEGKADAVTTTSINKESLKAAGVPFIGHTEIIAALCNSSKPLTLFEVHGLRVFFLTRHLSLKDACDAVTQQRIYDCARQCFEAMLQLGIKNASLAVAGLNPHCGEHGLFGSTEEEEITPAVNRLKAEGYNIIGPIGADSVFHQALHGKYTAVLSLYHDQGHIATKTLDFERTVSITAGLPILRTSVDHGTAFDIAGKGIASEVSLIEAIKVGAHYASIRAKLK